MPAALLRLVIDASVLRAAGETDHATSAACRKFLRTMLQARHLAALSSDLESEWRKHASALSRRWWTELTAQDRIFDLGGSQDHLLAGQIRSALPHNRWRIAQKDMHLVIGALAADRLVISCDDSARRAFVAACPTVPQLQSICWLNPVTDKTAAIAWLRGDAEAPCAWNLDPSRESA